MVDHAAQGVGAAPSRTRVHALGAHAGQVRGAVGAEQTLGTAVGRRAQEARQARARRAARLVAALGVGAARVRLAGVGRLRRGN